MTVIEKRSRKVETLIYIGVWIVGVGMYLLDEISNRYNAGVSFFDWRMLWRMLGALLPLFILFEINNLVLIPRLLLRNQISRYLLCVVLLLVAICTLQYVNFNHWQYLAPGGERHAPPPPPPYYPGQVRTLLPLPLLLNFTYSLVVVGVNLTVALISQHIDDLLEREKLKKSNAETELSYLKAQINPHFYMNMLNNIHGMVEINPDRAQQMLIDMSKLLRYALYDSSKAMVPLGSEIEFIKNHLSLVRQRFPEDLVRISLDLPSAQQAAGENVAPMLFLVFIENAFKHGVSYNGLSYVDIRMEIEPDSILFRVENSVHPRESAAASENSGIGLRNAAQRISLIYGEKANMNIESFSDKYVVSLSIPRDGQTGQNK